MSERTCLPSGVSRQKGGEPASLSSCVSALRTKSVCDWGRASETSAVRHGPETAWVPTEPDSCPAPGPLGGLPLLLVPSPSLRTSLSVLVAVTGPASCPRACRSLWLLSPEAVTWRPVQRGTGTWGALSPRGAFGKVLSGRWGALPLYYPSHFFIGFIL